MNFNSKQKKSELYIKLLLAFCISLFIVLISRNGFSLLNPLRSLELKFIDERFKLRGTTEFKEPCKIVIVEITQDSYNAIPSPYNSWPWPRKYFAKLIRNLNKAGAKAIGIDLVMSNKDQFSAENDTALFNAIREYKNVVIAGKIPIDDSQSYVHLGNGNDVEVTHPDYRVTKNEEDYDNIFYKADSSVGIVQVASDNDGVFRNYMPYILSPENKRIPSFGFAVLNKYYNLPSTYIAKITPDFFILGTQLIPKFDNCSYLVNFYGSDRTFPHYNFVNIIDDKDFRTADEIELGTDVNTWDDPEFGLLYSNLFKNKIVLIGSTMPEDKDILPVSYAKGLRKGDNLMYGVEFHANMLQNVLDKNYLLKESKTIEILTVFLFTFFAFFLSVIFRIWKIKNGIFVEILSIALVSLFIIGIYYMSVFLFTHYNFVMTIISPTLSLILGLFASTAYNLIKERKQKTMIKGMFSRYLSKNVVDELLSDPEKLKLGGEKKELTVFFSDVAGFSTFSEQKKPEELIWLMNEYLSEMTRILLDNRGTLDKYVGDAIMAFWGAPLEMKDHAFLACKAALLMQKRLLELRIKWKIENQPLINARIGITTGDMIVGNVGGSERFDYTVMGDNVNVASRLEGANKIFGTSIMISQSTYEKVKAHFLCRELDRLIVKGKSKPICVFELIDFGDARLKTEFIKSLEIFNNALERFHLGDFQKALQMFEVAHVLNPGDKTTNIYIERCKYYIETPPFADWDGVFVMNNK